MCCQRPHYSCCRLLPFLAAWYRLQAARSFRAVQPLQGDGIGYSNIARILEAAIAEGYSAEVRPLHGRFVLGVVFDTETA